MSRRALLLRTGAGVAAAGAAAVGASVASLAQAAPVMAAGDDFKPIVVGGTYADVRSGTLLLSRDPGCGVVLGLTGPSYGLQAIGNERGVDGVADGAGGTGVMGATAQKSGFGVVGEAPYVAIKGQSMGRGATNGSGVGVFGSSRADDGAGVQGDGPNIGVKGTSAGTAVQGVGADGGIGAHGTSTSGIGVLGNSDSYRAVVGVVKAQTGRTIGVMGEAFSAEGTGVRGWSAGDSVGVYGYSGGEFPDDVPARTGVLGQADQDGASVGVRGRSASGRGGVFAGKAAQVRLAPSSAATHPASGQAGDLFVDKSNRLWLCKGGTRWKLLG